MADSNHKGRILRHHKYLPGSQMSKPSIDGSQPDFRKNDGQEKSRRLTRELSTLQHEIRVDFDQRISDLTSLMGKFRALMASDIRSLNALNNQKKNNDVDIPTLTDKVDDAALAKNNVINTDANANKKQTPTAKPSAAQMAVMRETARFEAGLYQLNCQLYRFRLELDQEMEYRQEPLHVHFSQQSELSTVLQEITQKKNREQNTGN